MRKHYLDNIRWATIVLVVIYHVLYMYNAEGILGGLGKITNLQIQHYDIFQYLVYPWFMPVLFLVAGISSRLYLDTHADKEFVKSRTLKLLVPSTIGLLFFQFIQGYVSMSLGGAFEALAAENVPAPVLFIIMLASGSGVLWFCHLLWLYSIVLVLFRKAEKGKLLALGAKTPVWLIVLFYFVVWGGAQILNTPIVSVYRCAFYFVFFMLGYYVLFQMQPHNWIVMICYYVAAAIFVFFRYRQIKEKEGVSLFDKMRSKYQPWEERELALKAAEAGGET